MDIRLPPCFPAKASSPKVTVPSRVGGRLPVSGICQGRLVHSVICWAQCIRQQWPLGGRKRTRQVWVGAGCLTRSPRREGHHGAAHSAASAQGQVARRGLPAPSQQPAPPVHPPLPAPGTREARSGTVSEPQQWHRLRNSYVSCILKITPVMLTRHV